MHQRVSWTYPPQVFTSVHLSTKSLGQDSSSFHLFSKTIGSRFTTANIKLGEDSPSWFIILGQDSLSNKQNNKE